MNQESAQWEEVKLTHLEFNLQEGLARWSHDRNAQFEVQKAEDSLSALYQAGWRCSSPTALHLRMSGPVSEGFWISEEQANAIRLFIEASMANLASMQGDWPYADAEFEALDSTLSLRESFSKIPSFLSGQANPERP